MGSAAEIEKALNQAGADVDHREEYVIDPLNKAASLFGTEEDILVTEDIRYFLKGVPFRLADLLIRETGRRITFNQPQ